MESFEAAFGRATDSIESGRPRPFGCGGEGRRRSSQLGSLLNLKSLEGASSDWGHGAGG